MMATILCIGPAFHPERIASLADESGAEDLSFVQPDSPGREGTGHGSLDQLLPVADAILIQDATLSADLIRLAERCVLIAHAGAGPGGIDLDAARDHGILVTSIPDAATELYAALTLSLLEEFARLSEKRGGRRLRRLGLIGLGRVGSSVARSAAAKDMEVWAVDPFINPAVFVHCRVRRATLYDLLGICDAISIHRPPAASCPPMLDRAALDWINPGACLINTSNPGLVDLPSLLGALGEGRLSAAALTKPSGDGEARPDAVQRELAKSLAETGKLRWLQINSGADPDVRDKALRSAADVIRAHFAGIAPRHLLVDPPLPRSIQAHMASRSS